MEGFWASITREVGDGKLKIGQMVREEYLFGVPFRYSVNNNQTGVEGGALFFDMPLTSYPIELIQYDDLTYVVDDDDIWAPAL